MQQLQEESPCSRDDALPWRESQVSAQCADKLEQWPRDPELQHSDIKEEDQEEETGINSNPPDVTQVGGKHPIAPDGGWGWVVLVATMFVLSMTTGFPSCIGIFYNDLQMEFSASNTETSWVMAIMVSAMYAGGILCSVLVEHYGCRVTVIVGGLLSGLSMAASSLARTIGEIYITSAITGLGFCLSFQPSVTIIGHYFVCRRVFANAISTTGTAVGLSIIPLISNALLRWFGLRGSYLILGGVLLNCCVCGAIMRPVAPRPKQSKISEKNNSISPQQVERGLKDRISTALLRFVAFLHKHMAFDLLASNVRYRCFCVNVALIVIGLSVPLIYLVPYAVLYNISADNAALLMSVLGFVNIAVRPAAAVILGLPRFRGSIVLVFVFCSASLTGGLSNCICAASASFGALLTYVVIIGMSMSVTASLMFTVLMDLVELSRFPSAFGLLCLFKSIALLVGPPLAGMLVDLTGQYSYVFYASGVCVCAASLYLMGFFFFMDRKEDRERKRSLKKASENCQTPFVKLSPDCHDALPGNDL
ncbi:monocarboxylate transporter 6 [Cheilinus undulatus]|uniref:monocarboxylate transporter 6 n=1 Tax=Cheilinus undulatus TaxID=241271 RepID=UPI001BD26A48|nr:monocarboxylate transporter 6 [Cheilinus undulatus]